LENLLLGLLKFSLLLLVHALWLSRLFRLIEGLTEAICKGHKALGTFCLIQSEHVLKTPFMNAVIAVLEHQAKWRIFNAHLAKAAGWLMQGVVPGAFVHSYVLLKRYG
jgi:hypothetical protein